METPFTESKALLALILGDQDRARRLIIEDMLPNERRTLGRFAQQLADLCDKTDREYRAAHGDCAAVRNCGQPSVGYFYARPGATFPMGVCAQHRASVVGEGFTVCEMPEVKL